MPAKFLSTPAKRTPRIRFPLKFSGTINYVETVLSSNCSPVSCTWKCLQFFWNYSRNVLNEKLKTSINFTDENVKCLIMFRYHLLQRRQDAIQFFIRLPTSIPIYQQKFLLFLHPPLKKSQFWNTVFHISFFLERISDSEAFRDFTKLSN